MATYPEIPEKVRTFYDKVVVHSAMPVLVHTNFGQTPVIPAGKGDVFVWHKIPNLTEVTTALSTEGVVPAAQVVTVSEITAEPKPYGAYVRYTEEWNKSDPDGGVTGILEILGRQAGLTADAVARLNLIAGGYTAKYTGSATARNQVSASIDYSEFVKAVAALLANNAPPFPNGRYACIMHPETYAKLLLDSDFRTVLVSAQERGDSNTFIRGPVGTVLGVDIYVTTTATIYPGSGSGNVDVMCTFFLGAGWYGIVGLHAAPPIGPTPSTEKMVGDDQWSRFVRAVIRPDGSDPFGRVATVAWLMHMDVKVLDTTRGVGLESAR